MSFLTFSQKNPRGLVTCLKFSDLTRLEELAAFASQGTHIVWFRQSLWLRDMPPGST